MHLLVLSPLTLQDKIYNDKIVMIFYYTSYRISFVVLDAYSPEGTTHRITSKSVKILRRMFVFKPWNSLVSPTPSTVGKMALRKQLANSEVLLSRRFYIVRRDAYWKHSHGIILQIL